MGEFKDITGNTYGRWTVIGLNKKEDSVTYWFLRCQCGTERVLPKSGFVYRKGSCGCLKREMIASGSRFGSPPAYLKRAKALAERKSAG